MLTFMSFGTEKIVRLLALVVLARILSPSDFGIATMVLLVVNTMLIFKDWGFGSALVYRKEKVNEAASAMMLVEVGTGIVLTTAIILTAPLAAKYFNEPSVVTLLRVLSLSVLFASLGSVPHSLLQKELDFKRKMIPDVSATVGYAVVAIGLALAGLGVWSLVLAELSWAVINLALVWIITPWRPSFSFDKQIMRELIDYGKHVMVFDLVVFISSNLDYIIIGRALGAADLGLYQLAFKLATYPAIIIPVISRVMFPALAKLQDDSDKLTEFYLKTLNYASFLTIPAGIGLLAIAPVLIPAVFGAKWTGAITTMQVLIPFSIATILTGNTNELFRGAGRPDIQAKLELTKLIVLVPALWYLTKYGIFGVGLGQSIVLVSFMPLYMWAAVKVLKKRTTVLAPVLVPTAAGTVIMLVLIKGAQVLMSSFPGIVASKVFILAVSIMVGIVSYGGYAFYFNRHTINELYSALKRGLHLRSA